MDSRLLAYAERPAPRYTSYPTAQHFNAGIGEAEARAWLRARLCTAAAEERGSMVEAFYSQIRLVHIAAVLMSVVLFFGRALGGRRGLPVDAERRPHLQSSWRFFIVLNREASCLT